MHDFRVLPEADSITFGGHTFHVDLQGFPLEDCRRCWGTGHYSFNGEHSICYLCDGVRYFLAACVKPGMSSVDAQVAYVKVLDKRARAAARREAKRAADTEAAQKVWDANRAARDEVIAARPLLADVTYLDNINYDRPVFALNHPKFVRIASRFNTTMLTEVTTEDLDYLESIIADLVAKAQATPEVPEGRCNITGVVMSTKWVEVAAGYNTSYTLKGLILDDRGFKVWGTIPRSLTEQFSDADLKGLRISFAATCSRGSEKGFGFYSRPTKAAVAA